MSLLPARREARPARPWNPLAELEDMHRQIDRVFDQLVTDTGIVAAGAPPWAPAVDVEETDDAWIVEADLPGAKRQDITVEVAGDELAVHGEVKERERVGVLRRRTRRIGQFDYRLGLPGEIEEEAIEARFDDGVLTVRVPKSRRAHRRRIDVKG
jgi:HSP20 family protein